MLKNITNFQEKQYFWIAILRLSFLNMVHICTNILLHIGMPVLLVEGENNIYNII